MPESFQVFGPGPLEPGEVARMYPKCYAYWKAGRCPCCGNQDIDEMFVVIGEGVRLCYLCAYRGHHEDEKHCERLLLAIAGGAENAHKNR